MLEIDYEWAGQVFTVLMGMSILIFLGYQVREFHRRGMERVRRGTR